MDVSGTHFRTPEVAVGEAEVLPSNDDDHYDDDDSDSNSGESSSKNDKDVRRGRRAFRVVVRSCGLWGRYSVRATFFASAASCVVVFLMQQRPPSRTVFRRSSGATNLRYSDSNF